MSSVHASLELSDLLFFASASSHVSMFPGVPFLSLFSC
jgi:hypothetical protein